MKRKDGMSLIELLIVLGIMSVMFLIVLGMSSGQVGRTGLKGSANELVGEINTVRGRAAKENRAVALSFTSTSYKEHFFENGVWDPLLSDSSNPDGTVATGTQIKNSTTIVFNSQGILIDPATFMISGNITITLESKQGEGIKVKVYSYGGIKTKNTWRDYNEYGTF